MSGAPGSGKPAPAPRHVLVVCSPQDDAEDRELLAFAAAFAERRAAVITVLAVASPLRDRERIARITGHSETEVDEALAEDHRTRLEALVQASMPGLDARLEVRIGTRFEEVIRFVLRNDVELVLKTAEALRGIHRYLFASTDQHLLRKCPCPTWLRFPGSGDRLRTVVAAVDVEASASSEPDTLAGLNQHILETAVGLADADGAVVHVVHVWDAMGEGLIRSWSHAPDPLRVARTYVDEVEAAHRQALKALIRDTRAGLPDAVAERVRLVPRIRRGDARTAIPEDVRALGADVLVMGTVARLGVPGFIIGNTAEDVLNSLEGSVVTVKPPGYVTPLAAALL